MNSTQVVILAAGKSTRFLKNNSKLLEVLLGKAIINRVVDAVFRAKLNPFNTKLESCVVIVGHQAEEIMASLNAEFPSFCKFVKQEEQLGTGDALLQAQPLFEEGSNLLVINGDLPVINDDYLESFASYATSRNIDLYIGSCCSNDPRGYGRIIEKDNDIKIVEQKDLTEDQEDISVINGGVYWFEEKVKKELNNFYKDIVSKSSQKEVQITDFVNYVAAKKDLYKCDTYNREFYYLLGVNTQEQLVEAEKALKNGY